MVKKSETKETKAKETKVKETKAKETKAKETKVEKAKLDQGEIDFENITPEDIALLIDLKPFIYIENKPISKDLKSKDGPDLHSGDMGDPVVLETAFGWVMNYHLPKGDQPAYVEVGRGMSERAMQSKTSVEAQTFYTAVEVIDFLETQGWRSFSYKEGSPAMSWAVWAYLKFKKMSLRGYKHSADADMKFKQSWHLFEDKNKHRSEVKPMAAASGGTLVQGIIGEASEAGMNDEVDT